MPSTGSFWDFPTAPPMSAHAVLEDDGRDDVGERSGGVGTSGWRSFRFFVAGVVVMGIGALAIAGRGEAVKNGTALVVAWETALKSGQLDESAAAAALRASSGAAARTAAAPSDVPSIIAMSVDGNQGGWFIVPPQAGGTSVRVDGKIVQPIGKRIPMSCGEHSLVFGPSSLPTIVDVRCAGRPGLDP